MPPPDEVAMEPNALAVESGFATPVQARMASADSAWHAALRQSWPVSAERALSVTVTRTPFFISMRWT